MWNPFGKKQDSSASGAPQQLPKEELFDDLPPKFEDDVKSAEALRKQVAEATSIKAVVDKLTLDDFKHLNEMPCFRRAMLTGTTVGVVMCGVLLSTRSTYSRAINWTAAGFFVGSILSWEQCRYKMRQERRNVKRAQEIAKGGSS